MIYDKIETSNIRFTIAHSNTFIEMHVCIDFCMVGTDYVHRIV
jgi:hypothetical protein